MKEYENVVKSVHDRLLNLSKKHQTVFVEILNRYGIECVLKRIELSDYSSKLILKGSNMFILWRGGFGYRPTMDADFEFRGKASVDIILGMFAEIVRIVPTEDDGLRFDASNIKVEQIRANDEYGGVRVNLMGFLGRTRIPLQFDIGVGDAITPAPRKESFPTLLEEVNPKVRVYPKETFIAEKFETIVKRGIANSRLKDYFDLYYLSQDESVDMQILRAAVKRTFSRRKTAVPKDLPFGLTESFASDSKKLVQWNAFLHKSRLQLDVEFSVVVAELRQFYKRIVDNARFV